MRGLHKRMTTLQGEYVQNFERARTRFFAVVMFFTLAFVIVSGRLVYLMGPGILAGKNVEVIKTVNTAPAPKRNNIVDRNGMLLATSLSTRSLYADPKLVTNPEELATSLVKIFPELSREKLIEELSAKKRRFTWIKRHISPKQYAAVLEIGEPALNVKGEYRRFYPQGALLSHIIGFTNIDGLGIAGLEKQYDSELRNDERPIQLTIDLALQDSLHENLQDIIKRFQAIGGSGIVMDVKNGEILAMTSLPDFDPHDYANANDNAMFNRNTTGVYEMGSTFKTFAVAAALENKATKFSKTYDVREPLKYGRFRINDYHPFKRLITMPEVFIHSSNIGTAQMALDLGGDKLKAFYQDLGFFDRPAIDLPERSKPLVPNPWREISTVTTSYGHGIAVTPLHVARATAAMVNGGTLPNPHLMDQTDPDAPQVQVISPETSNIIAGLMALTVEKGTGSKAAHADMWVGGKTGTSEKTSASGGYAKKKLLSSFVGVFPADQPRYVILVTVDEPKGQKESWGYATGGWTAAPVAQKTIQYMKTAFADLYEVDKAAFPALQSLESYVKEDDE